MRSPVITYSGHQPESHKYFSGLSVITISFLSQNSIIASLLCCTSMGESSSDNAEIDRALHAVAQNMLSPVFKAGDTSTQPRWVLHQTLYDSQILTLFYFFWGNVNTLWIRKTRRTIPATKCPRVILLLGVFTRVKVVPLILLTPLLTLASNTKPRMMLKVIKSRRRSPLSKSNIRSTVCSD